MSHRVREAHVLAPRDLQHGVASDDVLFERSERDCRFDGGARNVAVAKCNLLIHDRENAAGVGINSNHRAVVAAESRHRGFANDGIIERTDVRERGVRESGHATETRHVMRRAASGLTACCGSGRRHYYGRGENCGQDTTSELLHPNTSKLTYLTADSYLGGAASNLESSRVGPSSTTIPRPEAGNQVLLPAI